MRWKRLPEYEAAITRGTILRAPARLPLESWVDLILMDDWQSPSSFSLWICSGKQAGLPLVRIPKEATDHSASAVRRDWLIQSWQAWIYPDAKPEEVFVCPPYQIDPGWIEKKL